MAPPRVLVVGVWGFPGAWLRAGYLVPRPPRVVERWGKLADWDLPGEVVESHSSTISIASGLKAGG